MTATITPDPNVGSLAVRAPNERRRHYEQALSAYARIGDGVVDGIVLAENSGADLEPFRELMSSGLPFEALNVASRPSVRETGRGYLETMLVADAIASSELLASAGTHAIKTTGRYVASNLPSMLRAMDFRNDMGFNTRWHRGSWVDLWMYFTNQRGAEHLAAHAEALLEGTAAVPSEQNMRHVLDLARGDGLSVQRRFNAEPRFTGIRGWDGRPYSTPQQQAKWVVRSVAKRVVPWIWI